MLKKIKDKYETIKIIVNNKLKDMRKSQKGNIIMLSIISVFIFFTIIWAILLNGYTKEEILSNFKTAVETENINLFNKCIKIDDSNISKKDVNPLMEYYVRKKSNITNTVKELRNVNKSGILELKSKKRFLKEKYYINVKKVDVTINSNINGVEVTLNNRSVKAGDTVNGIIPGIYEADYILKTEFGDLTGEKEIVIDGTDSVNVEVDAGNITLYSNFNDADVYIGGKNIGKKVEEVSDFGPIPLNKGLKLYIEKEFPWGKIKSDEVTLNSSGLINVDINMVNEALMTEMDKVLNEFFNSVFEALNEGDESLIKNADEYTKEKIYDDIFKKTLFFKNNYKISDLNLKIENSELKYEEGVYKGNIVVKVNYDINKKLLPVFKSHYEELFLVGLRYEEGVWTASSVQRFSAYSE